MEPPVKDANDVIQSGGNLNTEDSEPYEPETETDAPLNLDAFAPTLQQLYGPTQLEKDRNRSLVSLAKLPGWDGSSNQGWGSHLDRILGGGICPGYIIAVGASHAGAGKTAWIMQIADGLALRTIEVIQDDRKEEPLTPVLVLSEMTPQALTWRTLARWTGYDSRIFRAGKSAPHLKNQPDAEEQIENAFNDAHTSLEGKLGNSRKYIRYLTQEWYGKKLIRYASELIDNWKKDLFKTHQKEIWPIIVIDPIQRWQASNMGEIEALNELVEALGKEATNKGWIVLATSDTNKTSATRSDRKMDPREEGTMALRGSYKLLHLVDAAIYLKSAGKDLIETVLVKNRWGTIKEPYPKYCWDVTTGRFDARPALQLVDTGLKF